MKNVKIALLVLGLVSLNSFGMEQARVWYKDIQREGNRVTAIRMPDGALITVSHDPGLRAYSGTITERRPHIESAGNIMQRSAPRIPVARPLPLREARDLFEELTVAPVTHEKG